MAVFVGAAVLGLICLVVFQVGTIALVLRRLAGPRDHGGPPPPGGVSILRPVCGLEHAIETTLASSFHIDHPCYEPIFCVTGVVALMLLWYAAEVPLAYALGSPAKLGTPLFWIARDLLVPILWVGDWLVKDYSWRGRAVDVQTT
jgi:hypothetical protein